MARALAFTRETIAYPLDHIRSLLVCSCAIALIAAGQSLPFAITG